MSDRVGPYYTRRDSDGNWQVHRNGEPIWTGTADAKSRMDADTVRLASNLAYLAGQHDPDTYNAAYAAGRRAVNAELVEALRPFVDHVPHSDDCRATWDIMPLHERTRQRTLRNVKCPLCDRFQNARTALANHKGSQ